MPLPVEFHPGAREDLAHAAGWYEQQRAGLGVRFVAATRVAIDRCASEPSEGAPHGEHLRRMFVQRFPYDVLFASETDRVLVVAIGHFRRHPEFWSDRV